MAVEMVHDEVARGVTMKSSIKSSRPSTSLCAAEVVMLSGTTASTAPWATVLRTPHVSVPSFIGWIQSPPIRAAAAQNYPSYLQGIETKG